MIDPNGGIDQQVNEKVDAYRGNPNGLMQRYQQNQQLIDLLALQKLKSEKEAAARHMQLQMQQQPQTIAQQREQEVMGLTKDELTKKTSAMLQQRQARQQNNLKQVAEHGIGSIPSPQRPPQQRPAQQAQPQRPQGMAAGGLVALQKGGAIKGYSGKDDVSLVGTLKHKDLTIGEKAWLVRNPGKTPQDARNFSRADKWFGKAGDKEKTAVLGEGYQQLPGYKDRRAGTAFDHSKVLSHLDNPAPAAAPAASPYTRPDTNLVTQGNANPASTDPVANAMAAAQGNPNTGRQSPFTSKTVTNQNSQTNQLSGGINDLSTRMNTAMETQAKPSAEDFNEYKGMVGLQGQAAYDPAAAGIKAADAAYNRRGRSGLTAITPQAAWNRQRQQGIEDYTPNAVRARADAETDKLRSLQREARDPEQRKRDRRSALLRGMSGRAWTTGAGGSAATQTLRNQQQANDWKRQQGIMSGVVSADAARKGAFDSVYQSADTARTTQSSDSQKIFDAQNTAASNAEISERDLQKQDLASSAQVLSTLISAAQANKGSLIAGLGDQIKAKATTLKAMLEKREFDIDKLEKMQLETQKLLNEATDDLPAMDVIMNNIRQKQIELNATKETNVTKRLEITKEIERFGRQRKALIESDPKTANSVRKIAKLEQTIETMLGVAKGGTSANGARNYTAADVTGKSIYTGLSQ